MASPSEIGVLVGELVAAVRDGTRERAVRDLLQSLAKSALLENIIASADRGFIDAAEIDVMFDPFLTLLLEDAGEGSPVRSSKTTLQKWQSDAVYNLHRLFGEQSVALSDVFAVAATRLREAGRYGEALEYCGRSLLMRINLLGHVNPKTADSHLKLGQLYHAMRSFDRARRELLLCRGVYEKLSSTLGIALSNFSIGELEVDALNFAAAYHAFYSSYCARLEVLGPFSPLAVESKTKMENYRYVNGERHVSTLELLDNIHSLQWSREDSSSAEYTISVFIRSIKDSANHGMTLTDLKSLVKTAVKYSLSRANGITSPPSSPSKVVVASPKAGTKDFDRHRDYSERILSLLLNEDWNGTLRSDASVSDSEFTEEEKDEPADVKIIVEGERDDQQTLALKVPQRQSTVERKEMANNVGAAKLLKNPALKEPAPPALKESAPKKPILNESAPKEPVVKTKAKKTKLKKSGNRSDLERKQNGGTPPDDMSTPSLSPSISSKHSIFSESAAKKTSIVASGDTILPFSMGSRLNFVCKDRSGVVVEVRVLDETVFPKSNLPPRQPPAVDAKATNVKKELPQSVGKATIPLPPPLPTSWPPVAFVISAENFRLALESESNDNSNFGNLLVSATGVLSGVRLNVSSPRPTPAAAGLTWDILDNTVGTVWADDGSGSDAVVPWKELFSDFDQVFNKEAEKEAQAPKPIAAKKPSVILAVKDAVESKISTARQKKIELMLSRIGREVTVNELATALDYLDTEAIDLTRQSLIQENFPTADEIASVTELSKKIQQVAGNVDANQLQRKLGLAQYFILELSKVTHLEMRVRFIHDFHLLKENLLQTWKSAAETLSRAAHEVRTSPKLPFLFSAILQVANSFQPDGRNATSFKLSSLSKLWASKGVSGVSVETYIVKKFLSNETIVEALYLEKDLTFADSARSVDFAKIKFEISKLSEGVNIAKQLREHETKSDAAAKVEGFIKEASTQIQRCSQVVENAEASFAELCTFVGEDIARSTPGTIFGNLVEFVKALTAAVTRERR